MTKDTHNYSLRLPPELYRALNALAGVRTISLSQLMIGLLEDGWQKAPEKEALQRILNPAATALATPKEEKKEDPKSPAPKPAGAKKKSAK